MQGLYLSYNDYVNHKLSFTTGTGDTKATQIYFHEFIDWKTVTVMVDGKKKSFVKAEIYGYHNYNNDYRYFENRAYQIMDTTGFCIYSNEKLVQQGKGRRATRVYYFSTKLNSAIQPLTPENIARAFPKNHKFKYMVEAEFKSDVKLDAYDNEADRYKIKELYNESLQ